MMTTTRAGFSNEHDGVHHRRNRRHTPWLPGKAPLTEEVAGPSIATTASFPCSETTASFTLPSCT